MHSRCWRRRAAVQNMAHSLFDLLSGAPDASRVVDELNLIRSRLYDAYSSAEARRATSQGGLPLPGPAGGRTPTTTGLAAPLVITRQALCRRWA